MSMAVATIEVKVFTCFVVFGFDSEFVVATEADETMQ